MEDVACSSAAQQDDDVRLMERLAAGDAEAFRLFYGRYSSVAFALCLRIMRDRGDAEDVLADVFLELWKKSDRYDPSKGSPYTYLMVLSRSRALDMLRRRKRRPLPDSGNPESGPSMLESTPGGDKEPADHAEATEARQRVRALLETLPLVQRQAIELAYYEALSHRQIAERLAIPLGTAKSHIRNAMSKLKTGLKDVYDPGDA